MTLLDEMIMQRIVQKLSSRGSPILSMSDYFSRRQTWTYLEKTKDTT